MAATSATNDIVDDFEQFLKQYYREEIGELARLYPQDKRSLEVDWMDLYRCDPDLADDYLQFPEDMREKAEEALRNVPLPLEVDLGGAHVRVTNIGETTDLTQASRNRNANTLIETEGQVAKVSKIKPKIENAAFECQRCGTLTRPRQSGGNYRQPHECQGCERQGPFQLNVDQSEFVDHQMGRIQKPPQQTKGGTATKHEVALEDDLVGAINPGDEVRLTGKVTLDQSADTDSGVFPTKIEGRSVTIEESDFGDLDVDDHLIKPDVFQTDPRGVEAAAGTGLWQPRISFRRIFVGLKPNDTTIYDQTVRQCYICWLSVDTGTTLNEGPSPLLSPSK